MNPRRDISIEARFLAPAAPEGKIKSDQIGFAIRVIRAIRRLTCHIYAKKMRTTRRQFLKSSFAAAIMTAMPQQSTATRTLLKGGRVLTLDRTLGDFDRADVLIEGSKIVMVQPDIRSTAKVIDASQMIVMPGSSIPIATRGKRRCETSCPTVSSPITPGTLPAPHELLIGPMTRTSAISSQRSARSMPV
jgi:hypothetical protein